ncbi:MAG: D-aminoacyl-tRNA deacylase [Bacteroidota bacterium]
MKVVIQRVTNASVEISNSVTTKINYGLLIFVGIEVNDSVNDVDWLAQKIYQLRIFNDDNGLMNLNVNDAKGEILVISQFTLHAKTKKGNRPSFIDAAKPEQAIPLYNYFIDKLSGFNVNVKTGKFGAMMKIILVNDGPVTIIIDSKNKE